MCLLVVAWLWHAWLWLSLILLLSGRERSPSLHAVLLWAPSRGMRRVPSGEWGCPIGTPCPVDSLSNVCCWVNTPCWQILHLTVVGIVGKCADNLAAFVPRWYVTRRGKRTLGWCIKKNECTACAAGLCAKHFLGWGCLVLVVGTVCNCTMPLVNQLSWLAMPHCGSMRMMGNPYQSMQPHVMSAKMRGSNLVVHA